MFGSYGQKHISTDLWGYGVPTVPEQSRQHLL